MRPYNPLLASHSIVGCCRWFSDGHHVKELLVPLLCDGRGLTTTHTLQEGRSCSCVASYDLSSCKLDSAQLQPLSCPSLKSVAIIWYYLLSKKINHRQDLCISVYQPLLHCSLLAVLMTSVIAHPIVRACVALVARCFGALS
jgi:hypothetical protein